MAYKLIENDACDLDEGKRKKRNFISIAISPT